MIMKRTLTLVVLLSFIAPALQAQRRIYQLPQLSGYLTLAGDFHMHTVFSDGDVWPTMRVDEAWAHGLDVIAITDHIEFDHHDEFLPRDLNGAWKVLKNYGARRNVITIHGAEITKNMPPGHINALFITDGALLKHTDPLTAIEAAAKQGAFLIYDHPGWITQQADGVPRWYDMHETMRKRGWLHGVEFSNGREFYKPVLDWVKDKQLTVIGNSDIHASVTDYYSNVSHRPMTLVFAKERSEAGVREALFAGRTAVWFDNIVAGREDILTELVSSILTVEKPYFEDDKMIGFEVANASDIPVMLSGGSFGKGGKLSVPARSKAVVMLSKPVSDLTYQVDNFMCGESKVVRVTLNVHSR